MAALFVSVLLRTHALGERAASGFNLTRPLSQSCTVAGRLSQLPVPIKVRVLSAHSLESIATLLVTRDDTFCHTCGCMNNNCLFSIWSEDENKMNMRKGKAIVNFSALYLRRKNPATAGVVGLFASADALTLRVIDM